MEIKIGDMVLAIPRDKRPKKSVIGIIRKCFIITPCEDCTTNGFDISALDGEFLCISQVLRKATREEIAKYTMECLCN